MIYKNLHLLQFMFQ